VIPLRTDGVLELAREDMFRLDAKGFAPGTQVTVWMFSQPQRLAKLTVGPDGLVRTSLRVPKSLKDGLHHVVLVGVDQAKKEAKFEFGLDVGVPADQWWVSRVLLVIRASPSQSVDLSSSFTCLVDFYRAVAILAKMVLAGSMPTCFWH
jgi:hypothetical protein